MEKKRSPDSVWVLYLSLALSCAALLLSGWGVVRTGEWHVPSTGAFNDFTAGVGSLVTAAAVVIGGSWAYFKFVRGRTFVARLSIELDGEWRRTDGMTVLHVRVRVKNIGASKVALNQFGSGLHVSFAYGAWYHRVEWDKIRRDEGAEPDKPCMFKVLKEHTWIEPGETVSDELLLQIEGMRRRFCALELTMLTALSEKHLGEFCPTDTENFARRIVAPDDQLLDRVK